MGPVKRLMLPTRYIHLPPDAPPQTLGVEPGFAAIVIIDGQVSSEWRHEVSEWLVEAGCLNMMAWGHDCSLWDDSVDIAKLEAFDWKDIPKDKHVTTSWHEDESLEDVFHFSKICGEYSKTLITGIIILDITEISREDVIMARYDAVEDEWLRDFTPETESNNGLGLSGAVIYTVLGLIILLLVIAPPLYYGLTR